MLTPTALSAQHWFDIKLVAAWISGACFVYGFQLVQRIPRVPQAPNGMGPDDKMLPSGRVDNARGWGRRERLQRPEGNTSTAWPTEVVSTRRR